MSFDRPHTRLNLTGAFSGSCPQGTTPLEYTVTQNCMMDGAEYSIDGDHNGVKLTFGVYHPVAGLLEQFVDGIYAFDHHHYEFYTAELLAGLIIKVDVYNPSATAIHFYGNLYFHVDKE